MRRPALLSIAAVLAVLLGTPHSARADQMTFQLTVGDVLASVGRTHAFLVSRGRQARSLKLVPGGTRLAGRTCAVLGDVHNLASIPVLDGGAASPERVTTQKGKDGLALAAAFGFAGLTPWVPPASDAETDRQFWTAAAVSHGEQFAAEALTSGSD